VPRPSISLLRACSLVEWLGAAEDRIAMRGLRKLWRQHVDAPAVQHSRELSLDADAVEGRKMAGLKIHQYVDVAVGAKPSRRTAAKKNQLRDVMPTAERRHRVAIDRDVWVGRSMILRLSRSELS
jgi:hypothetical protein